ncbi:MAG: hypothetical protein ACE5HI_05550 [bacterium]
MTTKDALKEKIGGLETGVDCVKGLGRVGKESQRPVTRTILTGLVRADDGCCGGLGVTSL